MPNIACDLLAAVDDIDETFFIQFFRVTVEGKPSKAVPLPGAGFLGHDSGKADKSDKADEDDVLGKLTGGLAGRVAKPGKRTRTEELALVKDVAALHTTLASGGLWQQKGIPVGGATWLIGVQYRQTWTRSAMGAGRLIAAVPVGLYPGNKRIDLKIWNKTVEVTSDTAATESLYSTEITSSDKWSIATKKLFATETSSDINPSATLNSLGVSVPGTVGVQGSGAMGISGSFSSKITDQIDTTNDYIAEQTAKSAASLKNARTIRVEVTKESGLERTTSETLQNPNRGNTLNYLYWEILETYEIDTAFHQVDLYLSVPLPLAQDITPQWLLEYECVIRPSLPCATLTAGFDAAKVLLRTTAQIEQIDAQLGGAANASSPTVDRAGDKLVDRAAAVVEIYKELSGANVANGRFASWVYWSLVDIVAKNDLARGLRQFTTDHEGLGSSPTARDVSAKLDSALAVIGSLNDVFGRVNAAVASLATFSALFGCGVVPPLGAMAVVLITSLAVLLETLNIDAVPDDEGLEKTVRAAKKALDAYQAASGSPTTVAPAASGNGFDPQLRASLMREQLMSQKIEAQIEYDRLHDHVTEEFYKYHHAIWAGWSASRIAQEVQKTRIDPSFVEHRFYGFDQDRGLVRVVDMDRVRSAGVKWDDLLKELKRADLKPKNRTLQLPAPGAWGEAVHGSCDALDAFVARHRDIDLAIREAYLKSQQALADQQVAEVDRLKARIAAGLLDDPTPYGRADRLELELEPKGDASAASSTSGATVAASTSGAGGATPP